MDQVMPPSDSRIRVRRVETLSDDWYVLKKTTFDLRRRDGSWQSQTRETYDRGHADDLIEAPAGLLESASPEDRIRAETEEETGYHIHDVQKVFEAFMSPGSVTEKLYFFVGRYSPSDRMSDGGGNAEEGEDIETFETSIDEAMTMIASGEIQDGKTIMLLQHAALHLLQTTERIGQC
jgi:8-oxo-dGTP pyrophosphatase MutT (NUDIX family)